MPSISSSVGRYGRNRQKDVEIVQSLLNEVPEQWGGPVPKLDVDGLSGPKTIGAIFKFQESQLPTAIKPDGRVDPDQYTFPRLVEIASSKQSPGRYKLHLIHNVSYLRQTNTNRCWAAVVAMAMSQRDSVCYQEMAAVNALEASNKDKKYLEKYRANTGISANEWDVFLKDAGMKVPLSKDVKVEEFYKLIRTGKPIVIVFHRGIAAHCTLLVGIKGDQSRFGTYVFEYDPTAGKQWKNFATYRESWLNLVDNPYRTVNAQIGYYA